MGRADDRGLFKRGRRWYLRLYVRGEGKRVYALKPAGETHATTNKDVAREIARGIRARLSGDPRADRPAATIETLLAEFRAVNATEASERQARDNHGRVKRFLGAWTVEIDRGSRKVKEDVPAVRYAGEITVERVQKWIVRLRTEGRSPKTLWNHRGSISRFCEFLIDRGDLSANPCRRVRMAKVEKLPPRFLSPEEYEQILRLAGEHGIFAEVATALYTGMRREELRRMKWADVDFDRGVVLVPRSKSRRPRTIPVSEKLRDVLSDQRRRTGGRAHVFPGSATRNFRGDAASGMRRGSWWIDALKPIQAAMPVFTEGMGEYSTGRGWHLFRHTFASRLVQAGVPLAKVSAWLGHADIRTTMIYAHLAPGHDEGIEHA